jgi:L-malate glycosyltransferase
MLDFVTIFPACSTEHLRKDVGMIPFVLQRDHGFCSQLVTSQAALPAGGHAAVPGMSIRNLDGTGTWSVLKYIFRNARRINVLNLYHHSRLSLVAGWLYKSRNRKGILYLKLDAAPQYFEQLSRRPSFKRNRAVWSRFFRKYTDIVSCESGQASRFLQQYYPGLTGKLLLIPNGIDVRTAENVCRRRLLSTRKTG